MSYRKDDRPIAERLVVALRAAGKSVWWDDALAPTEAWDAMIEKEIAAAKVVLVLWTPRSVQSDWVRSEAHYAQDHHKLIPVLVEKCSIPLAFMLRQAVDLTDGRFDSGNPQWEKLLAWIEAVDSGDVAAVPGPHDEALAVASVPVKAATGASWLGPAPRSRTLAVVAALVVILGLGGWLGRGYLGLGQRLRADVYVDAFKVAADPALPSGFDQTFAGEMSAQLSAGSAITPIDGDGKRHPDAYQMSGNIRTGEGKVLLFAKVFAPGIDAPVLSPRIEVPIEQQASAAKSLAVQAAGLLRCISTASDSSRSAVTVLPEAAIRPWAKFCQYGLDNSADSSAARAALEGAVKADPGFAAGWSNLAEVRLQDLGQPGNDNAKTMTDIRHAIDQALAVDDGNPKALMLKALDQLGVADAIAASRIMPLGHFRQFEALAEQANSSRPTDCGCEASIYAQLLMGSGRITAALPLVRKVISNDPSDNYSKTALILSLSSLGRDSEARQFLDDSQKDWPDSKGLGNAALSLAIERRDWAAAKVALPTASKFPHKDQAATLIDALQSGNRGQIDSIATLLFAAQPDSIRPPIIHLLSTTGHEAQLIALLRLTVAKNNLFALTPAWSPSLRAVRARPEFAQLMKDLNLPTYWRQSGHRPDVCQGASPEPFCAVI